MKGDIKETFHTQKQIVTEEYRMFGLGPDLGVKFGMIMREMLPLRGIRGLLRNK